MKCCNIISFYFCLCCDRYFFFSILLLLWLLYPLRYGVVVLFFLLAI